AQLFANEADASERQSLPACPPIDIAPRSRYVGESCRRWAHTGRHRPVADVRSPAPSGVGPAGLAGSEPRLTNLHIWLRQPYSPSWSYRSPLWAGGLCQTVASRARDVSGQHPFQLALV